MTGRVTWRLHDGMKSYAERTGLRQVEEDLYFDLLCDSVDDMWDVPHVQEAIQLFHEEEPRIWAWRR